MRHEAFSPVPKAAREGPETSVAPLDLRDRGRHEGVAVRLADEGFCHLATAILSAMSPPGEPPATEFHALIGLGVDILSRDQRLFDEANRIHATPCDPPSAGLAD